MKNGSNKKREKTKMTRKEYAIQHFTEFRKSKSSVIEIAKTCHVTPAFIYKYVIPEVVKRTGISKDDLLYQPHSAPVYTTKPGRKPNATTEAGTTEPANVAQEAATEPEFTGDVAPSIEEAVEEAATVQTATFVDNNPTADEPEATVVAINPILKKILDDVNAVRQIVKGLS